MRVLGGLFTAACLLTTVTACSGGSTAAAPTTTPAPPSSTSAKPSTSAPPTPSFTPAVSPDKVTGACPFLGQVELAQILGVAWKSEPPVEQPPEQAGRGNAYRCSYTAGELYLVAMPGAQPPSAMITRLQQECEQPATPVPGAGEVASYCYSKGASSSVFVGKRGHGQTRVAQMEFGRTRSDVCEQLAKLLGDRL